MNLKKTSFYTSLSAIATFISGFLMVKVVAVKIGPEGIAYLGQFQNTVAILNMLATGAITIGIIKYLAEFQSQKSKQEEVTGTALLIMICCSLLVSVITLVFSGYFSNLSFKDTSYSKVYLAYGICTIAFAFNLLFPAILNGQKKIKWLTAVNVTSSIIGVLFMLVFTFYFGITGALISSSVQALAVLFFNILIAKKAGISLPLSPKKYHKETAKKLFKFSLMAAVSGLLLPFTQMQIREIIIHRFSFTDAGYWQAITKVSDYYLAFITSILAVYYLPRLSEIDNKPELRKEIFNGYKIILPVVMIMAFAIWVLKEPVIHILFSRDFLPAKSYFTFQLLGDVFKIGSWLLAYLMLAKALTKEYIITEILFSASLIILSKWFIGQYGVIGATYAFALNYGLYWILMWWLLKKYLYKV